MTRKGKIHRLDPEARVYIEKLLDEDRWTLDEVFEAVKRRFPDADFSRSGLHRYQPEYTQMRERMREIERVSDALVGGLGEGGAEKANRLLAQAVTTAVTHAALKLQTRDDDGDDAVSMSELKDLSLAAGRAMKAQRLATEEALAIAEEARNRLLREQQERLSSTVKAGGLSQEFADTLRNQVLGIE
jgi:hypothetical protein